MSKLSRILTALVFSAVCFAASAAPKPSFKISLDSAHVLMGNLVGLKLEVIQAAENPGQVIAPVDSLAPIELVAKDSLPELVSESSGEGKRIFTALYKLQAFDSGDYKIPPFIYILGKDTVLSNSAFLKVIPVDVSEMKDINPAEGAGSFKSKWFDWMPDFITDYWYFILLGIVIIAGGICTYLILSKKVAVNILPKKKERPPYLVAMDKLGKLKEKHLWEQGFEKPFYTELTEILREYLDRRFGINAMEMTSRQIMQALNSRSDSQMPKELMQQVLEIADYVKFARVQPLREDNIKSFDAAVKFVEDTKPAEPTEADGKTSANSKLPDDKQSVKKDNTKI